MSTNNRQGWPDLLKGIAVLLMIQVHLMELFARPEIASSLPGKISLFLGGPPAAPVFMVVMGIFLAQTKKTTGQLLGRGALLFGGGLLLNIGLNAHLLVRIALGEFTLDPWTYLFGVDILFLAGLSVMIIALTRPLLEKVHFLALLLALGFSWLSLAVPDTSPPAFRFPLAFLWGKTDWSYFPLVPWIAWPLAGFFLGRVLAKPVPLMVRTGVLVACGVVVVAFFPFGFRTSVTLPEYYHHGPLFFLWALSFVVLVIAACTAFDRVCDLSFLKWLGRHVTAAYVFQWLLIGNIATAVYQGVGWGDLLAWCVAIVLAVILLVYGWERMQQGILSFNRGRKTKPS